MHFGKRQVFTRRKKITSDNNTLTSKKIKLEDANRDTESCLETSGVEINSLIETKNELDTEVAKLNEEFERVKLILTPTSQGRLLRKKKRDDRKNMFNKV